jgi:hypothetical protein
MMPLAFKPRSGPGVGLESSTFIMKRRLTICHVLASVLGVVEAFGDAPGHSQFALVSLPDLADFFPEYSVEFGQSAAKTRLGNGI